MGGRILITSVRYLIKARTACSSSRPCREGIVSGYSNCFRKSIGSKSGNKPITYDGSDDDDDGPMIHFKYEIKANW